MIYRPPYWIGGILCDYDEECLMACEMQRLDFEEERAAIPTIDLSDPQSDE